MIIINYKLVTKSTGNREKRERERVKANKVGYRPSALASVSVCVASAGGNTGETKNRRQKRRRREERTAKRQGQAVKQSKSRRQLTSLGGSGC